jgi:hypothetical protein
MGCSHAPCAQGGVGEGVRMIDVERSAPNQRRPPRTSTSDAQSRRARRRPHSRLAGTEAGCTGSDNHVAVNERIVFACDGCVRAAMTASCSSRWATSTLRCSVVPQHGSADSTSSWSARRGTIRWRCRSVGRIASDLSSGAEAQYPRRHQRRVQRHTSRAASGCRVVG